MPKCFKKDSVSTPKYITDWVEKRFGVYNDPCPLNQSFDPACDEDGLTTDWKVINYVNPPYSEMKKWVLKGFTEYKKNKTVIMLVKMSTLATKYFQLCPGCEIVLFENRVRFPGFEYLPRFPSCLLVYRAGETNNTYSFFKSVDT